MALAFVVTVVLAEAGARLVALRLGESSDWNDPGLATQVRNMRRVGRGEGGADVVLLGSSAVGEGIDPERLAQSSQAAESAYNAWHAGAPASALDLMTRALVLPILRPRLVVIGLTSEQLNDNGTGDDSYEALRSSSGRPRVPGDETITQRLERRIVSWSYLVRLRSTLRRPNELVKGLRAGPDTNPYNINTRGMSFETLDKELQLTARHLEQNRQALADYHVGSQELPALGRLVHRLRGNGVAVLIVNMPVLQDAYVPLHPRGSADHERYQSALESFTRTEAVPYLNANQEPWGPEWFADENHVNGRGSARLTKLVSTEVDRVLNSGE